MNESKSLFRLVKALTPSERRYITIAIKSHYYADAYHKLLKEMFLQHKYDEVKLKERLKKEPFIKHFAVIKNQLFQFMLTVLSGYHKGSSLDFRLKEMMLNAAVLNQKALYTESWQLLQRTRQLALKFEDWKVLLEILYKEFMLVPKIIEPAKIAGEFIRINEQLQQFVTYLTNYEAMAQQVIMLCAHLSNNGNKRGLQNSIAAEKLMQHPLLASEKASLTCRARMIYFYCWSTYLVNCYQYKKAVVYLEEQVHLFENNQHFIDWIPGNYILAFKDLLMCSYLTGDFAHAEKMIARLRDLSLSSQAKKTNGPRYRMLIFSWTYSYEIGLAIHHHMDARRAASVREKEDVFITQMSSFEGPLRLNTLLALASFYYYDSNPRKVARLTEKIIADPATGASRQAAVLANTLQIILHFEEGEEDMIHYLLKRLERIMAGKKNVSATEKKLAAMCKDFPAIITDQHKKKILLQYHASFLQIKQEDTEKHYYLFFDVSLWLQHYCKK